MAKVVLAAALTRWLDASAAGPGEIAIDTSADTLDSALDRVFAHYPKLHSYVLDEHGGVRHHVAIFVDGAAIRDKQNLRIPVGRSTEIYILQALSGG
jgi:molybdopterin synthase sulfur carrier subunit